jgi:tetratricopeptide (TPR) repeat protein
VLAGATIALYSRAAGYGFVLWDDRDYVTENPHVKAGLDWSTIKWAFTSTRSANWHPLTWLSHAFDCQLFALNPAGYHLHNVLLHALNAVLLFLLLAWMTRRTGPSLLVAALFAVHPLNVESVAWVSERKSVLSTLFFLLAIGAYAWYARRPGWRRYGLVAALFALGLMAKPMVITLPFVLLLLDYWPLERTPGALPSAFGAPQAPVRRLLLEKVPLLLLSAASAAITLVAQRRALGTFEEFSFPVRAGNAVVAYASYLGKMLWPVKLAARYPHPGSTLPAWQVVLSALLLAGITALAMVFRRRRYLPAGWFWFLGTLVPVIGLVQVGGAAMADRYAYIPLIGIFAMIAWSLADWAESKSVSAHWRVGPALCVLAGLSLITFHQIGFWESEYALWMHTLAVTSPAHSGFAHVAVANALRNPETAMTPQERESFDTAEKQMEEARRHYETALNDYRQRAQQSPDDLHSMAMIWNDLGLLDGIEGRTGEARAHLQEALQASRQLAQQNPDKYLAGAANTLINLAGQERTQNLLEEARGHYEEAARIYRQVASQDPDKNLPLLAATLGNLGALDGIQNRPDEARRDYEEALDHYQQLARENPDAYLPDVAAALDSLGGLEVIQRHPDEARLHLERALQLRRQLARQNPGAYLPDVAVTLNKLAIVDQLQNRIEEARARFQEALALYRKLLAGDPRYGGDAARVEASLRELDKSRNGDRK